MCSSTALVAWQVWHCLFALRVSPDHLKFIMKVSTWWHMLSAARAMKSCLIRAVLLDSAGSAVRSCLVGGCCSILWGQSCLWCSCGCWGNLLLVWASHWVRGVLPGTVCSQGLLHLVVHLWVGFSPPDLSGFNREGRDPAQSRAAHTGCGPECHGRPFGREDEPVCQPPGCSGKPGCSTDLPSCQRQPGMVPSGFLLPLSLWTGVLQAEVSAWCNSASGLPLDMNLGNMRVGPFPSPCTGLDELANMHRLVLSLGFIPVCLQPVTARGCPSCKPDIADEMTLALVVIFWLPIFHQLVFVDRLIWEWGRQL